MGRRRVFARRLRSRRERRPAISQRAYDARSEINGDARSDSGLLRRGAAMIFLWGLLQDPTTRSVVECLALLGARVAFVNHADIARTTVRFAGASADSYRLTCGDASYELGEMSA